MIDPVFVSYYHAADQPYYEQFKRIFVHSGVVADSSLRKPIAGDNPLRILEIIAEQYIAPAACVVVLCGAHTALRPYVDWELSEALRLEKGLVGVGLPTLDAPRRGGPRPSGAVPGWIPDRLADNLCSGYALWSEWASLVADPPQLGALVQQAMAQPAALVRNGRPLLDADRLAEACVGKVAGG